MAARLALAALLTALWACGEARPIEWPQASGKVHQAGILDPGDAVHFHGVLLRNTGWRFDSCTPCHGKDLDGGQSGVSCLTCHPVGVTTCDTCHGSLSSGGHRGHILGLTQGRKLSCSECHVQPHDYRDPGHLYNADGTPVTTPVQVVFSSPGALAGTTTPGASRAAPPAWLPDSMECANVYCHGAVFADSKATLTLPAWNGNAAQAACGTCHGLPPQSHGPSQTQCFLCHNRTVDAGRALIPGGLHGNGRVELGDGSGTCMACHGGADGPAPPRDLRGNTDVSAIGVGAHQAHVKGTHRLRGPIPCGDCHQVPQKVDSPGHIAADLPAPVFPAGGAGSLASADGAVPVWDHGNARCAGVYCHGGGTKLGRDMAPGLQRAPVWTVAGGAGCGSCHGVPPADAAHTPAMRLTDCAGCHATTVDASGAILVSGAPGAETSAHINGVVDVVMKGALHVH